MTFEDWEFGRAPEGLHGPSARAAWRFRQTEIDEQSDAIHKLLAWSGVTIFPRAEWRAAVGCLLEYDPHQSQIETLTAILDKLHRALDEQLNEEAARRDERKANEQ